MAGVNEQRLTQRMIGYWQLIKKSNEMPQIEHFNSAAVEDLWQQCMMVSVDTRKGVLFKCEFMGDHLIKAYGRDMQSEIIESTNAAFPGVGVYKRLQQMVGGNTPQEDSGFFLNKGGDMVKYRACFLPFGKESKGLTHVIIGLSFRAF
ncbi:MAG: PAS domain-containing protein [Proteobacteria bacterium]|nr:PAS domain-containing protein [Pseudomonadota bacterium]